MNEFIDDDRALDFSPYVLAMTIIKSVCEKNSQFSIEQFEYVKDINFKNVRFFQCNFVMNCIYPSCNEVKKSKSKYGRYKNSSKMNSSTSTVASATEVFLQI